MDKDTNNRLNHLAIRCFKDIADQDYIHARLAHHGNPPKLKTPNK